MDADDMFSVPAQASPALESLRWVCFPTGWQFFHTRGDLWATFTTCVYMNLVLTPPLLPKTQLSVTQKSI